MLERIHLSIVQQVEQQGSLTAAAGVLNLTQSALSHSMKKLEQQLGTDVWLREGRSLRLTQAGQYLLAVANRVLPQLDLAEERLGQFAQGERGALRIGMECHPCYQWLLKLVAPYLATWPDVDVDVKQKFQFGGIGAHQLHPPAAILGIALVHAEQVAREQRRLVADAYRTDAACDSGEHDVVAPALDEPVEEGTLINVRYGRPLELTVDGEKTTHWVTATSVDAALGHRLMMRTAGFPNDRGLDPADVPTDQLHDALAAAEAFGFARLRELEDRAHEESQRQLERERSKLHGYFDYREQAARDRLESSRRVLARLEAADSAETRRIIPVWRTNVARDERLIEELKAERVHRLSQLDQRAVGSGDLRLVAVARVELITGESA